MTNFRNLIDEAAAMLTARKTAAIEESVGLNDLTFQQLKDNLYAARLQQHNLREGSPEKAANDKVITQTIGQIEFRQSFSESLDEAKLIDRLDKPTLSKLANHALGKAAAAGKKSLASNMDSPEEKKYKDIENKQLTKHNDRYDRSVRENKLDEITHALKGHPYHKKSDAELHYIVKDAGEAAKAMKSVDSKAESKYLDQVNDASTVLHYRSKGGVRVKGVNETVEEANTVLGYRKSDLGNDEGYTQKKAEPARKSINFKELVQRAIAKKNAETAKTRAALTQESNEVRTVGNRTMISAAAFLGKAHEIARADKNAVKKNGKVIVTRAHKDAARAHFNEEVVPGSVKKDKSGNISSASTVPDKIEGDTVYAKDATKKWLTHTGKITHIGKTHTEIQHKDGTKTSHPHADVNAEFPHKNPYRNESNDETKKSTK